MCAWKDWGHVNAIQYGNVLRSEVDRGSESACPVKAQSVRK